MADYTNWKGKKIRIPKKGYRPGGYPSDYTAKKVVETLEFYHQQLLEGDLHEALTEEREERHPKDLLDTAILRAITEAEEENLKTKLQKLLTGTQRKI